MSTLAFNRPPAATWRRAAAVLVVTLLAHAWVFDRVDRMLAGTDAEPPAPPVVNARLLEPPAPPPVVAEPSPAPVVTAPKPRPRAVRPPPPASPPPVLPAEPVVPVEESPAIEPPAPPAEPEVADAPAEPAGPVNAERPLEAPAEAEVVAFDAYGPVLEYALASLPELRAAMPGAARYVYRTKNSEIRLATGTTVVEWSIGSDDRYDLRLSTTALGLTVLDLHSQGTLRSFGLAPERYTAARRLVGGVRLAGPADYLHRATA
jgi:outer membrane biosynthesis protein TonB